jgi:hypothetical protein
VLGALALGFVYIGLWFAHTEDPLNGWFSKSLLILAGLLTPVIWIVVSAATPFGRADRIDSNNYLNLRDRLLSINVRLKARDAENANCADGGDNTGNDEGVYNDGGVVAIIAGDSTCQPACREASEASKALCCRLRTRGQPWTLRMGYTAAWDLIYKAEEALIDCERCTPADDVVNEAKNDLDRLKNSGMAAEEDLTYQLQAAIHELDPEAAKYVRQMMAPGVTLSSSANSPPTGGAPETKNATTGPRIMVRQARKELNAYRGKQYGGMLRARGSLIRMTGWTGAAIYLLTLLGILVGAKATSLATAFGLGILGALVGAFGRLYNQSNIKFQVEDLGLNSMQRVAGIVLSAIAAVLGVLLTVTLFRASTYYSSLVTPLTPTPTPIATLTPASSPPPSIGTHTASIRMEMMSGMAVPKVSPTPTYEPQSQGNTAAPIPTIDEVFDIQKTPLAPIIAAIFGLVPSLVLSTLQQEAARFQTNLLKTEASTRGDTQS